MRGDVVTAIIPARMASTRFPGKPLARILDLSMIEHVRRRTLLAEGVDNVVVATCDLQIKDAVEREGGRVVMTSESHVRCTERVAEAMTGLPGDIVVIVQGDEPLVVPAALRMVVKPLLDDPSVPCSNLLSPLVSDDERASAEVVKAACDVRGRILYFSRANIPCFRERVEAPVYRQTGIMAFRSDVLRQYVALPETPLERAESVDMWRLLEHGIPVFGVVASFISLGVDWPDDVLAAERALTHDPVQRDLYERTRLLTTAS